MVSATGFVVKPYMNYPTLMDSAFAILRGGGVPWGLRREVLRTLGILGALDPYRYQQIQLFLRGERLQAESLAAGASATDGKINNGGTFFSSWLFCCFSFAAKKEQDKKNRCLISLLVFCCSLRLREAAVVGVVVAYSLCAKSRRNNAQRRRYCDKSTVVLLLASPL